MLQNLLASIESSRFIGFLNVSFLLFLPLTSHLIHPTNSIYNIYTGIRVERGLLAMV